MRTKPILLLAASLLSFGQAPPAARSAAPPAEVDKALRSRATAFFQYQKDGNFRKSYELVAEDSKDYYFSTAKQQGLPFTIEDIEYTDEFSKATVKAMVTQKMGISGQQIEVPSVVTVRWKLEKGEWVWYHDPSKETLMTIVGELPTGGAPAGLTPPADASRPEKSSPIPKDLSPAAAAAAAAKLVPKTTIDKSTITFTVGTEATDVITFRNENLGQVRVLVGVKGATDDVTVEPVDTLLTANAELPVKVSYKPTTDAPRRTIIEFIIEPFDSVYRIPVRFSRQGSAAQK
jgi:hypothetical protein